MIKLLIPTLDIGSCWRERAVGPRGFKGDKGDKGNTGVQVAVK